MTRLAAFARSALLFTFDANRPDRVYFGHQLAYDGEAAGDSCALAKQFLHDHLKG